MLLRCFSTVFILMFRWWAMTLLDCPADTPRRTCCSRGDSKAIFSCPACWTGCRTSAVAMACHSSSLGRGLGDKIVGGRGSGLVCGMIRHGLAKNEIVLECLRHHKAPAARPYGGFPTSFCVQEAPFYSLNLDDWILRSFLQDSLQRCSLGRLASETLSPATWTI